MTLSNVNNTLFDTTYLAVLAQAGEEGVQPVQGPATSCRAPRGGTAAERPAAHLTRALGGAGPVRGEGREVRSGRQRLACPKGCTPAVEGEGVKSAAEGEEKIRDGGGL